MRVFQEIAYAQDAVVRHVKLHGALYNLAARDEGLAEAIVRVVSVTEGQPVLFVPAGSVLERVARARGNFSVAAEIFADRTYQRDGSLTPRSRPDALITDEDAAVAQVLRIVREGLVTTTDGTDVALHADTVCLHGDGAHAVEFARRLNRDLRAAGVEIRACGA
jgi:UPF0271 protein